MAVTEIGGQEMWLELVHTTKIMVGLAADHVIKNFVVKLLLTEICPTIISSSTIWPPKLTSTSYNACYLFYFLWSAALHFECLPTVYVKVYTDTSMIICKTS